jgi:hypothetical protein
MGENRNAYEVRQPGGKTPLERPWRRWEDNVKMYVMGWEGVKLKGKVTLCLIN